MFGLSENFYLMNRDAIEPDWMKNERLDYCEHFAREGFMKRLEKFARSFMVLFA